MAKINQVVVGLASVAILFAGCSSKVEPKPKKELKKTVIESFNEELRYKKKRDIKNTIPALILPPVYTKPDIISKDNLINFSATNAPLSKLLYMITKQGGLNLIVDNDVSIDKEVTANMVNVPLSDAIDLAMNISNTYFSLKGNVLHVKKLATKEFYIPFINMTQTLNTELGGDILGAGDTDSGIAGEFTLESETNEDNADYYEQLEESLTNILSEDGKISLNRFTGTLVVTDFKHNVDIVESVVNNLKSFLGKQVLIEAKIMEVILDNEHQLGVNWQNAWTPDGGSLSIGQTVQGGTLAGAIASPLAGGVATTMAYSKNSFFSMIQAMESSGTIEVVSNPKIKVINGQTGVITSGNMIPYWDKEVAPDTYDINGIMTAKGAVTYNRTDVLNGISLGVSPIIKKNGDVILNIIPIVTNIEGETTFLDDNGQVVAKAPIINVKEVGTTILTKDNDMIVIGGLISSVSSDFDYKTPGLGDVPMFGNLFKRTEKIVEKRELVIILKIDVEENR